MNTAYSDYLHTISNRFAALLGEIKADYNFDLGDEFEIAICKALRVILPTKYGICRGSVFTIDNKSVGDDIIIFDQWHFPVLRLLDDNNYAQKQRIPVEAVIAYIEAKNTIVLEDGHGNSLKKAIEQATAIKKLGRKEMPINPFSYMNVSFGNGLTVSKSAEQPQTNNPLYTCVFSRGIRLTPKLDSLTGSDTYKKLLGMNMPSSDEKCVDLFVFHKDVFAFPVIGNKFASPFFVDGVTTGYGLYFQEDLAWGIGVSLLFLAFESIHLGSMEWEKIIAQTLNMTNTQTTVISPKENE